MERPMKFNYLILISAVFSLNVLATTVPLSKPKIDALDSVLANEQVAAEEEEEMLAEEQNRQESEGYFERSNDPYISEDHRGGSKEVVAGNSAQEAENEVDDSDDF